MAIKYQSLLLAAALLLVLTRAMSATQQASAAGQSVDRSSKLSLFVSGPYTSAKGASMSQDDRLAIVAGGDGYAHLFELATMRELRRFGDGKVATATFSPNGRLILTGEEEGIARTWDTSSGQLIRTFKEPSIFKAQAEFGLDGRRILTSSGTKVLVWDADTSKVVRKLIGSKDLVTSMQFSLDGQTIVTASKDGAIRLWATKTGFEQMQYLGHDGAVDVALLTSNGRTIVSGGDDSTIRIWDVSRGVETAKIQGDRTRFLSLGRPPERPSEARSTFNMHIGPITAIALFRDGQTAASADTHGRICIWDVQTLELKQCLTGHTGAVRSISISADGTFILSSSEDGTTRLWEIKTGEEKGRLSGGPSPSTVAARSPEGRYISSGTEGGVVNLWDTRAGKMIYPISSGDTQIKSLAFSPDERQILIAGENVGVWDLVSKRLRQSIAVPQNEDIEEAEFSPDGTTIISRSNSFYAPKLFDSATGKLIRQFGDDSYNWSSAGFTDEGSAVYAAGTDLIIWDSQTGKELRRIGNFTNDIQEGFFLSTSGRVFSDAALARKASSDSSSTEYSSRPLLAALSTDGTRALIGPGNNHVQLWDVKKGRELSEVTNLAYPASTVWFNGTSPRIEVSGVRGQTDVYDGSTGHHLNTFKNLDCKLAHTSKGALLDISREGNPQICDPDTFVRLAQLVSFDANSWAVVSDDGRFDANNLENLAGLQWIASDDPLHALPPEIFMRDYYEPRLLPKILSCNAAREKAPPSCFAAVRPLAALNRTQPIVKILSVNVEKKMENPTGKLSGPDTVEVAIEVTPFSREFGTPGRIRRMSTGVYDVRLFRNGQLVGQWPEESRQLPSHVASRENEIEQWRKDHLVSPYIEGGKNEPKRFLMRGISLPRLTSKKNVEFSAYAFNVDRVKSETSVLSYELATRQSPPDANSPSNMPKAYVVTIGVNRYEASARDLSFAVSDANAMQTALSKLDGYEVVPVTLISDSGVNAALFQATKANIHEVLARLSGKSFGSLEGVSGAERLVKATPDDLLIVTFSGHGYTQADGTFYLLGSDSGGFDEPLAQALPKFISSEELGEWLRPIDAGEMALIIDACHSAASVEHPGFKPGPMGDRGLGQLAYDKAMRILAASQADDVALESAHLNHGLLTYALAVDGIAVGLNGKRNADTDGDGRLTLSEWLRYGEAHTPVLYEDIRSGKKAPTFVGRNGVVDPENFRQRTIKHAQTPALFDFSKPAQVDAVIN